MIRMKQLSRILISLALVCLLCGCSNAEPAQIAATTLPVYHFTETLCQGTDLRVARIVTENISCLHDYSLQVNQMRTVEAAEVIVISGGGLEDFLEDALSGKGNLIDASTGIGLLSGEHQHETGSSHHHETDPHFWLSIENARTMAHNIYHGLVAAYPKYETIFSKNLEKLDEQFSDLQFYARQNLSSLSCREIITFHDGFSYFADSMGLTLLQAVEEESGSEASAAELTALIRLVQQHKLPAIFTEVNGSTSAAQIIAAETGVPVYALDMAMSGNSYFDVMYYNIDTIKEALG